jgi:hypothetical protein
MFYSAASIRKFVALDASAANALHLFPVKMQSTNKYGSIFGIMEAGCRTVMGKRVLNRWLRQPLTDIDAIRGRQSIVKAFVDDVSIFYDVELELKQLPDMDKVASSLEKIGAIAQVSEGGVPAQYGGKVSFEQVSVCACACVYVFLGTVEFVCFALVATLAGMTPTLAILEFDVMVDVKQWQGLIIILCIVVPPRRRVH